MLVTVELFDVETTLACWSEEDMTVAAGIVRFDFGRKVMGRK